MEHEIFIRNKRIKELEQELKISDAAKEWAENQLALTESDVERLQAKLEAATKALEEIKANCADKVFVKAHTTAALKSINEVKK